MSIWKDLYPAIQGASDGSRDLLIKGDASGMVTFKYGISRHRPPEYEHLPTGPSLVYTTTPYRRCGSLRSLDRGPNLLGPGLTVAVSANRLNLAPPHAKGMLLALAVVGDQPLSSRRAVWVRSLSPGLQITRGVIPLPIEAFMTMPCGSNTIAVPGVDETYVASKSSVNGSPFS